MSFNDCTVLRSNYSSVKIKKNEMGGACSAYEKEEVPTEIWWGDLRESDLSENVGVDGRVILTFWRRNYFFNFSTPCI